MILPLFMGLGGPEILLIVLVIMLLFGGKKIPELMRGLGKGVKSFKDGVNGNDDIAAKPSADKAETTETTADETKDK